MYAAYTALKSQSRNRRTQRLWF